MKLISVLLACALAPTLAFAQTESVDTTKAETSKLSSEAVNPTAETAVNTTVATPATTEMSTAKWQLNLSSETTVAARAQKEEGFDAPYSSLTGVGAIYNLTDKTQFELRQYIDYANRTETLSGRSQQLHAEKETELSNLVLRAFVKTASIWGSKPITIEQRFYLPTDRVGRENKENGLSRTDIWATWDLNPKWNVGMLLSPRVLFNSSQNPNAAKGSDAQYYRLVATPAVTYNFSDTFSMYYAYNNDLGASEAQRGDYTLDTHNYIQHEAGLVWGILAGKVFVNPTIISEVSRASREAEFFTADSRVYSDETMTYNMNLYATF